MRPRCRLGNRAEDTRGQGAGGGGRGRHPSEHAELLGTFVGWALEGLASVEDALRSGDAVAIEETAHRLRGSAATLGAGPLAQLCESLEEAARARQLPTPGPVIGALRRELEVTRRVFAELATELAGPVAATGAP